MKINHKNNIHHEELYKEIKRNFKNKEFNFNKLITVDSYFDVLIEYIYKENYGYLESKLRGIKNRDKIEIFNLLVESGLINKPDLELEDIETGTKEDKIIEYEEDLGFNKEIRLRFKNINFPFKIEYIQYINKKFITKNISKNEIRLVINIEPGMEVNFSDNIIIYTSMGIDNIEIIVKSKKATNGIVAFKSFDEYIELIKKHPKKAKQLYENKRFKMWIEKKKYMTQILNMKEAKGSFTFFCSLNGIYVDESINQENNLIVEDRLKGNEKSRIDTKEIEKINIDIKENEKIKIDIEENKKSEIEENMKVLENKKNEEANVKSGIKKTNSEDFLDKIKGAFSKIFKKKRK